MNQMRPIAKSGGSCTLIAPHVAILEFKISQNHGNLLYDNEKAYLEFKKVKTDIDIPPRGAAIILNQSSRPNEKKN